MAYLALYRKYRPTTFENLIGQEHIVKTLTNQIVNDRLGHAYLFTGTRGTGKTSAAKIFAKAINCVKPINGSPCGECPACKALSDASNIDVIEIDAASNNGVNEIRDLREKVQYPPVSCKYKVYIIDEVHMLTGAAFNALLKTLEEPPKHAVFILATTEVHKIPATILSRCMRFDFRLIATERIAALIGKIYDEQGKRYEPEAVFAIAKSGEGSIRDALSIADIAVSYSDGVLKYEDVMEILGSSSSEILNTFINSILKSDSGTVLSTVDSLVSLGKSMGVLTKDITSAIRDLLIVKTCQSANSILGLPSQKYDELVAIANSTTEERLLRILSIFSDAENMLKYTNHPRVVFETAAVKATRPDSDYNIDALLSRIKTLEEQVKNGVVINQNNALNNEQSKIDENVKISVDSNAKVLEQSKNQLNLTVERKNEVANEYKKLSINETSIADIKGKLLVNLRRVNSEMLWNIIQNVTISVRGNTLILTAESQSDREFLDAEINRKKIITALEEFDGFDLDIRISETEKSLDAIDEAAERMKKIFGENIVIIK